MAGKLKQVQDAGVPILFRPLHEAEGGWFWWGAEGPEPCVELYRLLYDKFTNEYGLNNLIWVWTSYDYETSEAWYPGDDVVDIAGYDKYNAKDGLPNGSAISSTFYNLVSLTGGKKMVTMSENDTIPRVSNLINEKAGWLYFCPWYGWWLTGEQNNPVDWLVEMYQSEYCITLDELPDLKTYPTTGFGTIPTSTATPGPTPTPTEIPKIKHGDINGDGEIDSTDLTILKRYILRKINELSVPEEAADLNGDGDVNSTDITLLKRYLLRKIKSFPVDEN
jgi:mannan endo-1,4-beta-mannosidase